MSRFRTPHYGPHKGQLCREEADGSLAPVEVRDTRDLMPPVLIPAQIGPSALDSDRQHREAVDSMTGQLVEAGQHHTEARRIARIAVRRATGEHGGHIPYYEE